MPLLPCRRLPPRRRAAARACAGQRAAPQARAPARTASAAEILKLTGARAGVQGVVAGLRGTAAVCCEAVAAGLRGLAAGPDAQRGMRAAQRAVDIVASLSARVLEKTRLAAVLDSAELNADLGAEAAALGRAAACVVAAALDAAARMQAALLAPATLGAAAHGARPPALSFSLRITEILI